MEAREFLFDGDTAYERWWNRASRTALRGYFHRMDLELTRGIKEPAPDWPSGTYLERYTTPHAREGE